MRARQLAIEGAWEFSPEVFSDARGTSVQSLRAPTFTEVTGRPFFPVRQTLFSTSQRGVVRGIHLTTTPPGSQKYVYCAYGAALDMVVDLRVGSPTFGQWDAVRLDQHHRSAIYCPVGVGHAFAILEDDTVMAYLLSNDYVADLELAIDPLDSGPPTANPWGPGTGAVGAGPDCSYPGGGPATGSTARLRDLPRVGGRDHGRESMMPIRVWSYLEEFESERADILAAVEQVFQSGQLILGESVQGFEREFADYHGAAHCVGVDNGTNAVKLALEAVGVGPGDEVITVSNTAAPTVVAIDEVGATPVFVDVQDSDYLMDIDQVQAAISERTRCLLPVHLYGQCVDMAPLRRLADQHGLLIVEDCAQAHGARHHGQLAGTFSDAAAFSFYPTKVLGAYGDGGAVLTNNDQVAANLRRLRYYGMEERYYVVATPGHNSRLDEVQAEILRRKLRRLDSYIERRRAVARRYEEALADTDLVLPQVTPGNDHVYYVYVVRHPRRDEILAALRSYDIHLNISYPWPVHTMTGFAHLGYDLGTLPVTERLAQEIFSLPMYPSLSEQTQQRVIEALREVLSRL